ncbi:MAG: hypothetical protein ACI828_001346 [Flavobacteriales bacterium]|jgi:hypothetical protein
MIRLSALFFCCILLTACSKDEAEVNNPEQEEQHDDTDDSDDSADNTLIINTSSNYLSTLDRSFLFFTIPASQTVGGFVEISNGSTSFLALPDNPNNAEYDLHIVYISKDFFNEDQYFTYTYKNFDLPSISLFRDDFETNECDEQIGTATVHYNTLPIHIGYMESESNCVNKDNDFESPFSMTAVTVNGDIPSYYLAIKNLSSASYVEIDNLNANQDYFLTTTDFNSDMSERLINVAENVSLLKTERVDASRLHYGTLGFLNKIKGSNPIPSPTQVFLPNIDNRIYKSTAVYEDSFVPGGFSTQRNASYDIHSSSGSFDTSEIVSEVSIADINDLANLNITKSGDAVVAYAMTAFDLIAQNGINYSSNFFVFLTLTDKAQFNIEYPQIPSDLLALFPELKASNLSNTEKFNVGIDHEQYLEASNWNEYMSHFFMSDGVNNRYNWLSGRKRKFDAQITGRSDINAIDSQQDYLQLPPKSTFN